MRTSLYLLLRHPVEKMRVLFNQLKKIMELAEWLVRWAPELVSWDRSQTRSSSMMHILH